MKQRGANDAWFEEARYGLFLHWGLYALLGHEHAEWVLFKSRLDRGEYNRLADQFTAARYDPHAWAALAKRSGMRYAVLTTRHHDGFCLFKTATTAFHAPQTAAGRDLVAEYVAACRRAGLRVGLYYSIMSWQHPAIYVGPAADPKGWAAMVAETHAQVRELMSHYGPIDLLWYDGAVVPGIQDRGVIARFWRSRELNAMVRRLQPHILINDRSGLPEDFATPEQHVNPPSPGRRWEACMTLNRSWGYNIADRDFKAPLDIVRCLVRCARYGGNLLLNVGPRADGTLQPECTERLEAVGAWLARNGEAIYGARRTPYTAAEHAAGPTTWNGRRLYVHLFHPPRAGICRVDGAGRARRVCLLGSERAPRSKPAAGGALDVVLPTPAPLPSAGPAVLALDLPGAPDAPAHLLGGGEALRIVAGNTPVLGDDPDRHTPPDTPVWSGAALRGLLHARTRHAAGDGARRCPGWHGWSVFTPRGGNRLDLTVAAPVAGRYELALGIVADRHGTLDVTLDGHALPDTGGVRHPGCPDTCAWPPLTLTQGRHRLSVSASVPFGLYALKLTPRWRPLPSEHWWTIGPFPTAFGPRRPVSDVRDAMRTAFPPETSFDRAAVYTGAGNLRVRWSHSRLRRGEHSDRGVNFPYRCGMRASGVCYARTEIVSPEDRAAEMLLGCDWWANVWVNGQAVRSTRRAEARGDDGAQFNGWKPRPAGVRLRRGRNVVLVKGHPGSCANWFSFYISDPGDLRFDAAAPRGSRAVRGRVTRG